MPTGIETKSIATSENGLKRRTGFRSRRGFKADAVGIYAERGVYVPPHRCPVVRFPELVHGQTPFEVFISLADRLRGLLR
jgi:hypothetical protein